MFIIQVLLELPIGYCLSYRNLKTVESLDQAYHITACTTIV